VVSEAPTDQTGWRVLLPIAAVCGAMAAFQAGGAVAKSLFPIVGPQGAAALRMLLAAAMLAPVVRPWRNFPSKAPRVPLLGFGICTGFTVIMFYAAISRVPLGVAISLQFLGPLSVAILGSRRPSDVLWAALAGTGVWALVGRGTMSGVLDPLGVGFGLAAAVGWAGYILFGRAASAGFGRNAATLALAIGAVVALPIGVAHAGTALLSPRVIPIALLVALFSTALPVSLEVYALTRMPARTFAVFMSLEPVFGAIAGLVILREALAPVQIAGVAAIVTAAAGAAWSSAARA
jgi:inner membrane transporter RhtA